MWKYVGYGVKQMVKLPTFDKMMYLCDPNKIISKKKDKIESNKSFDVSGMIENGNYKDLIRMLIIDEEAPKEFDQYLSKSGINLPKYSGFMSKEEKLAEIESITNELIKLKKHKEELKSEPKKEEKKESDPNDFVFE